MSIDKSVGHWFCPICIKQVEPTNVTFEENCTFCGSQVRWIDYDKCNNKFGGGMLFNEPQNDYFKLTGAKPLRLYKYEGKTIKTATEDYLKYLENNYCMK